MRCRIAATTRSRRRSRRSSTTAGGAGAGRLPELLVSGARARRAASATCATTTSATISAIFWRAPSRISAPPGGAGCWRCWSAMSRWSRRRSAPGRGRRRGYGGHPEIELALVKLYRLTGERRHLDLAAYFVDQRGQQPHYFDAEARARGADPKAFWAKTYEYNQSHLPVREQTKVVGHAVRAMYLYTAMADLARELGTRPSASLRNPVARRDCDKDVRHLGPRPRGARTRASPGITTCPMPAPMPKPAPRSR